MKNLKNSEGYKQLKPVGWKGNMRKIPMPTTLHGVEVLIYSYHCTNYITNYS